MAFTSATEIDLASEVDGYANRRYTERGRPSRRPRGILRGSEHRSGEAEGGLLAARSPIDLGADLVGERLDRDGIQTSERHASLHLVEYAHERQELGVRERRPANHAACPSLGASAGGAGDRLISPVLAAVNRPSSRFPFGDCRGVPA